MFARLSLSLVALLASGATAQAADDIKPFGGIEWSDDVATVLTKLGKLDGVKTVRCHLDARYDTDCANATTHEAAQGAFAAVIKKAIAGPNAIARQREFDMYFGKYQTKEGKTIRYWQRDVDLVAESILLQGVLYRVTATFAARPGAQVIAPKNVIAIPGTNPPVAEPLVLDKVTLVPMPGNTTQWKPVWEALQGKYHFEPYMTKTTGGIGVLYFNSGTIHYARTTASQAEYTQAYQQLLSGAGTQGKEDTSGAF